MVVKVGVSSRCEFVCVCVCMSERAGPMGPPQAAVCRPLCNPVGLLRECVVGLLSFMAAAVNMTGCLETICFQWLPHGNRELNLRSAWCLSQR